MNPDLTTILAFVIGVIAVGRAARLLVFDQFPPTRAVREAYIRRVKGKWEGLFECPFCIAPYLAAGDLAWYLLGHHYNSEIAVYSWWVVNVWAAVSYLAAILVAYDQPE